MYAFAIQSAATEVAGIPISICEGDVWAADDPVVKSFPMFFSDEPKVLRRSAAAAKRPARVERTAKPKE